MKTTEKETKVKLQVVSLDDDHANVTMDICDFYWLMDMLMELEDLVAACRMREVQLCVNSALSERVQNAKQDPYMNAMKNVNQFIRFMSEYSRKAGELYTIYGNTDL